MIGSGVSGLTAAYLLQRRFDVTLYEADDRLGGHAHTHDVPVPGGTVPVDTGFIVHNARTYPNLIRLFDELAVETRPTEMSMSVRCDGCGLEYAGARGLRGVFARPRSLVSRRYLAMLSEIRRFHRHARATLLEPDHEAGPDVTFGEFLAEHRFSDYFVRHFALPLVATVWSSGTGDARAYPARYLFRFLDNHGMLSVSGSPQWRTVVGGSREYVERAAKGLSAVRTTTPVRAVARCEGGVRVRTDADEVETYEHAVIATHADQALGLLADPSGTERSVLGAFRSTPNEAVLHTDPTLLPTARGAAASWNYRTPACADAGARGARVTYDLNRLQGLSATGDTRILVSLGMSDRIDPARVLERMSYRHPVYTPESVAAQQALPGLMSGRIQFAGAWQGWGFHEDGCAAGVRAAARLGVSW